jgi:hypothetical protein
MYAVFQRFSYQLVGKIEPARGFLDVAFLCAIDGFCRLVRDPIDILMATLAFNSSVRTGVEELFIDVEEVKLTFFVDATQTPVFVTHHAVEILNAGSIPAGKQGDEQED